MPRDLTVTNNARDDPSFIEPGYGVVVEFWQLSTPPYPTLFHVCSGETRGRKRGRMRIVVDGRMAGVSKYRDAEVQGCKDVGVQARTKPKRSGNGVEAQ